MFVSFPISGGCWREIYAPRSRSGVSAPSVRGRARDADAAGADEVEDPVRLAELVERVELLRRPGQLEHDRVGADVEEPAAEGLGGRDELGPAVGRRGDADDAAARARPPRPGRAPSPGAR